MINFIKTVGGTLLAFVAIAAGVILLTTDYMNVDTITTFMMMSIGLGGVITGIYLLIMLGYAKAEDEPTAKEVDAEDKLLLTYDIKAKMADDILKVYHQDNIDDERKEDVIRSIIYIATCDIEAIVNAEDWRNTDKYWKGLKDIDLTTNSWLSKRDTVV